MAKYFDVQRALADGISQDQIDQVMRQRHLVPLPSSPSAAPVQDQAIPQTQTQVVPQTLPSQVQPPQQQGDLLGQLGAKILGLGQAVVQPAVDYGRFVGEGAASLGKMVSNPNPYIKALTGQQLTPQEAQSILNQSQPVFLSQNEMGRFSTPQGAAIEGAKKTAGALSYVVPFGRGAGLLSKAVLPGIASGALFEASHDNATPESVIGAGATGGLTAGVLSKALPFLFGAGRAAQGVGNSIERDIVNPQVGAMANSAGKEQTLVDQLRQLGINQLTAQGKREASSKLYDSLNGQIDDALANSPAKIGLERAKTALSSSINEAGVYHVPGDPTYEKLLDREMSLLDKKATNGVLTVRNLFDFKNNLSKQLGNAFDKEAGVSQSAITPQEGVRLDLWHRIDDMITGLEPGVKDLTQKQSLLHQAATGLKASASKQVPLEFLGTRAPGLNVNQATQAIGGFAGKTLQSGGSALDKILSAANAGYQSRVGQGLQAPALLSLLRGQGQSTPQSSQTPISPVSSVSNQAATAQSQNVPQRSIPLDVYQKAMLSNNLTKQQKVDLKAAFAAQESSIKSSQPAKLTGQARTNALNAQSGLDAIDKIDSLLKSDPSLLTKAMLPGGLGARTYITAKKEAADVLTRLRTGAALNEDEMKFYQGQLPAIGDNPEDIQYKLNLFRGLYRRFINP